MSFAALAWASKLNVGKAADKLILLAYADRHNEETDRAYPSIAWLCEFSSLDRKTVIAAVGRLEAAGLITDTGVRAGNTKQIKVYRVNVGTVPKTEQSQKRNSPKNPVKQSQKRDTEPVREPITSGGKPPSVERARDPGPDANHLMKFVNAWNAIAERCNLPLSRGLNGRRKAGLQRRIAEHGEEAVLEAIRNVGASEFMHGKNERGWRADFGWMFTSEENFLKVLEGRYGSVAPSGVQSTVLDRVRADLERKRSMSSAVQDDDEPRNPMVRAIIAEQAERAAQVRPIGQIFDPIGGFDE